MAGEVKLAIILTGTMRGSEAFDKAGGGIKGIGKAIKSIAPMLALFAAKAAFDFLKDSIKVTMEFEQALAEAGSIIGKTADEMHELGLEIRAMSKEIPKSPQDLAVALYDIFSAGIVDTADAMKALELSAKTASAGLTQTATAAKAGISTMNAFGMEASSLEHIFDVQFLTIKFGILRYEELASVVGQLSPAAKAAGQSMESMFASLAILTKKGLNAAEASTALARAMEGITRPAAIKAATLLGISFIELTDDTRIAKEEFVVQKRALDELSSSYADVEGQVKSLSEEMAKVSLEEAKNRLEISKIRRQAELEGRDMQSLTEDEITLIAKLENANKDLALQYDELSVASMETSIQATEIENAMAEQKVATDAANKAFDEQIAATGNFRPLVDIIQEIGDKYGHLGEAAQADIISKMFPQIRAKRAVLSIMGSEQELMNLTDEMIEQSGAMGEAFAINTDTAAAGHKLMENSMADLKIEMGEEMMPVMEMWHEIMRDQIIPLVQNAFIPILKAIMPVISALAGVLRTIAGFFSEYPELLWAIIGALIAWKVIQLALNVVMAANPLGLIVIAIASLIAGIVMLVDHLGGLEAIWNAIGGAFKWVYDNVIKPVFDGILFVVNLIIDALKWLWNMINDVAQAAGGVLGGIADVVGGVGGFFGDVLGGAADILGEAGGLIGFQHGGIVTKPTLGLLGESGAEAVIPLRNGAVPVSFDGAMGTSSQDTYNITIQTGVLPETETPESIVEKMESALIAKKMRGATGG